MEASSSLIISLCKYLLFLRPDNINYFVGVDVITACPEGRGGCQQCSISPFIEVLFPSIKGIKGGNVISEYKLELSHSLLLRLKHNVEYMVGLGLLHQTVLFIKDAI